MNRDQRLRPRLPAPLSLRSPCGTPDWGQLLSRVCCPGRRTTAPPLLQDSGWNGDSSRPAGTETPSGLTLGQLCQGTLLHCLASRTRRREGGSRRQKGKDSCRSQGATCQVAGK